MSEIQNSQSDSIVARSQKIVLKAQQNLDEMEVEIARLNRMISRLDERIIDMISRAPNTGFLNPETE